ncbi:MAG: hypothetical protein WCS03_04990 [Bacteroidota bacterium]
MEDKALSELLNVYDRKISESLPVNTQLLSELKTKKSYSQLKKLRRSRLIELAISSVISFLLFGYIYYSWNLHAFGWVISCLIIMSFTLFAVSSCIRQLILISKFNLNQPVIENQKILARLQIYNIMHIRMGILQIPFYVNYITIFSRMFFAYDFWVHTGMVFALENFAFGFLLFPFIWWVFKKISYKNMNIPWVKYLIEHAGGKTIVRAMEFLNEIDVYENKSDVPESQLNKNKH